MRWAHNCNYACYCCAAKPGDPCDCNLEDNCCLECGCCRTCCMCCTKTEETKMNRKYLVTLGTDRIPYITMEFDAPDVATLMNQILKGCKINDFNFIEIVEKVQ
jgi:hypothetical protein